jgi:hypothetical protein
MRLLDYSGYIEMRHGRQFRNATFLVALVPLSVSNGYQKRGRKPGRQVDVTSDPAVLERRAKALAKINEFEKLLAAE